MKLTPRVAVFGCRSDSFLCSFYHGNGSVSFDKMFQEETSKLQAILACDNIQLLSPKL